LIVLAIENLLLVGAQMHLRVTFLSTIVLCLCTLQAIPQSPDPYGWPINIEAAKKVAAAALTEAQKNNWKMIVSVVDTGGTLVYYEKMDNAQIGSAAVAIEKARTAVRFKPPSKVFQDMIASGGAGLRLCV
jgi:glc operon protein GlcG